MSTKFNQPENMSRRHFMRQAACAALGATALVNTMASLRLTSAAIAQGAPLDDYKALVCIFLTGGNDSNNLLVPSGNDDLRADYDAARGVLSLPSAALNAITVPTNAPAFGNSYGGTPLLGTHSDAPDIATLFDSGDLAFVCNVGTLAYPIHNRDDYLNGTVPVPKDLFSHTDQMMQWQTSVADKPMATGWGGRMAQELLDEGFNSDSSQVSMSMSFAGVNTFQRSVSPETAAFTLNGANARPLRGFGSHEEPYDNAYNTDGTFISSDYKNTQEGHRLKALESLIKLTNNHLLTDAYATRVVNSRAMADTIEGALAEAATKQAGNADAGIAPYNYDDIFENAEHDLGEQLKGVAQLIAGREALGNNRQIFFVSVGGYDVHLNHLASHADLMDELSTGLMAFRNALQAQGDWGDVVAFTASDFSRTMSPNGIDEDTGTDHAWGGHAMVMGGPVKGGDLYGHFPSLKLGASDPNSIDADPGRGRWIPSTSVDQYSSVLARWFGADSNSMAAIFPNLSRFDDPVSTTLANLNFIEDDSSDEL